MKIRRMPVYAVDQAGHKTKTLSRKFYAIWVDHSGQLRRLPLFPDRRASEECARKIEKLDHLRASNDSLPPELVRFLEEMPSAVRDRLAAWGIVPAQRVAASKPLNEHLDDWHAALLARGNTMKHADLSMSRAKRVFDACGFRFWSEISASRVLTALANFRTAKSEDTPGISIASSNYHLAACKAFCRWMTLDQRATQSPLAHLSGQNAKLDRRHRRRALSGEEMRWLLDVTEQGAVSLDRPPVVRSGMSATARSLLYHLAAETGLRANELRSLTVSSFSLSIEPALVTIQAAYAKNRRQDALQLRPALVTKLRSHLSSRMPAVAAFDMPRPNRLVYMFRADLKEAREAWIASHAEPGRAKAADSSFLAVRDDAGRVADFHCLRHTFISNLAAAGVHPKTAQQLARHSTIQLTMDLYSHVYRGQLENALDTLPSLDPIQAQHPAKQTGTNNG